MDKFLLTKEYYGVVTSMDKVIRNSYKKNFQEHLQHLYMASVYNEIQRRICYIYLDSDNLKIRKTISDNKKIFIVNSEQTVNLSLPLRNIFATANLFITAFLDDDSDNNNLNVQIAKFFNATYPDIYNWFSTIRDSMISERNKAKLDDELLNFNIQLAKTLEF